MDRSIVALGALLAAATAGGQTKAPDAAPPGAAAPYRSAFADYRAWREPAPMNWREANDTAGALGGHMGQLRGRASAPAKEAARPAKAQGDAK